MASLASDLLKALPDSPQRNAQLLLLATAFLLLVWKPSFAFDAEGRFKPFGTGPGDTIMPFWLAILLVGLFGYYLAFGLQLTR